MQVWISAPNKTFIGIDNAGNLVAGRTTSTEQTPELDFGPATYKTFSQVIEYLKRLSIHATDIDTSNIE